MAIEIVADSGEARDQLRGERRARLVAPEDDMWAHLAEDATPHAVVIDGVTGGFCTVDDEHQLRSFYVTDEFDLIANELFARTVDSLNVVAAMPSSVDPRFLTLSVAAGGAARQVGLMYAHVAEPAAPPADMRLATEEDHAAVVAFDHEQTDSPFEFLEPYLARRVEQRELVLLIDDRGQIAATGECRTDTRSPGHAHLGLIVRTQDRRGGIGRRVLSAVVHLARTRGLQPLCSTEPTNIAAQRVIWHAGFRLRHSVVLVTHAHREGIRPPAR